MRIEKQISIVLDNPDEKTGAVNVSFEPFDITVLKAFLIDLGGHQAPYRIVPAIKYLRERFDLSLKSAKDIVDFIRNHGFS